MSLALLLHSDRQNATGGQETLSFSSISTLLLPLTLLREALIYTECIPSRVCALYQRRGLHFSLVLFIIAK